jgi:Uma2 family endonuclease
MHVIRRPNAKRISFDEFCALVPDGQKADLLDGVIYVASPDNISANKLFMWFGGLMDDFAAERDLGEVFGSRVACKLDEENAPEPDIVFVTKRRRAKILSGRIDGPADLAVEIVSPESERRDYVLKREKYEHFGVREYWIIDEVKQTATFLRLDPGGKYREVRPRQGVYHSKVMKGFWFRLEWLWPETRPLKPKALAEVLRRKRG